jgi:hypothetical protein
MVAIFEPSPVPNQITKSGSNAIFGIGKIAETRGKRPARTSENSPIAKPTAMPSAVPNVQPTASRSKLAPRCFPGVPVRTRSINASSACEGARNAIGLITPYPLPSSHSAISAIKTKRPDNGNCPRPKSSAAKRHRPHCARRLRRYRRGELRRGVRRHRSAHARPAGRPRA